MSGSTTFNFRKMQFLTVLTLFSLAIGGLCFQCNANQTLGPDSNCYTAFNISLPQKGASLKCGQLGGLLISINNAIQNRFFADFALNNSISNYWTGGYSFEGDFWWPDGPFLYTNWAPGIETFKKKNLFRIPRKNRK